MLKIVTDFSGVPCFSTCSVLLIGFGHNLRQSSLHLSLVYGRVVEYVEFII